MDMRSLLMLSVLLALIRENNGENATVSLLPKFPDVFVGDDITLICKGGGEPTTWFINGAQQSHQNSSMLLTAVTSKNNGEYTCERGGSKSDPYTLTVLELEPHAQLSPSVGGAVMSKGGGRNLVLQVDEGVDGWRCYVLRGESSFRILFKPDKKKIAVIFAELKGAKRATFWCKNGTQRSNAVTLKMTDRMVMLEPPAAPALMGETVALRCAVWGGGKVEKAEFYKDRNRLETVTEDTYIITKARQDDTGEYRCHATYRFSHISADAAQQEGDSDVQKLTVIGGPPATTVNLTSESLRCSCRDCSSINCKSYLWYINESFERKKLPENTEIITVKKGRYSCRMDCGKGFTRFSNVYSYSPGEAPESTAVNVQLIVVAVVLLVVGMLVVAVLAVLKRRRGEGSVQAAARRDKDKNTGGDYEQIQLTDQAVYHTLGEGTDKDKVEAEGGYEALKKRQEEAVYHTLGAGQGQGEGQGGYEALKSVKAEVYQTLSSDNSKTPAGESEGNDEKLPQKATDCEVVTVEENPYEELKAGQQDKK